MKTDCIVKVFSYQCSKCLYSIGGIDNRGNMHDLSDVARIYGDKKIVVKECPKCGNDKDLRVSFIGIGGINAR